MAINPSQYPLLISAPMLQDYFVDKDTGFPLAGGIVTLYKDDARNVLKNFYYQTGVPGSYQYLPLPNPNTLTSVGTFSDNGGNDIIPYYFPYDEEDSDVAQPYFITVFSSNSDGSPAVPQFSRSNFPFISEEENIIPDVNQQDIINLIPNGQFTSHNDLQNNGLYPNGEASITVAQGGSVGWYYTKDATSADSDLVTFTQILQEPPSLNGNPRFAINIKCTNTIGADTFKQLRMRFNNVNRFASQTQFYTFSFEGINNSPSTVDVFLQSIKYFGTGGSATQETNIEGFTLNTSVYTQFSTSFTFGINSSQTIGTLNDDYVELAISLPARSVFDVSMTGFILASGEIVFNNYPERPDNMVFSNSISGSLPTPNPDGSDLYLPIAVTQAGANYLSDVGQIVSFSGSIPSIYLPLDGSTYLTSSYSSIGIPYSRLQQYLMNSGSLGIPLWGTGSTYATANINASFSTTIRLSTNRPGLQMAATEGAIPTGFSFSTVHIGQTSEFKTGTSVNSFEFIGICNNPGPVTAATAATSGLNVSQLVNGSGTFSIFAVSSPGGSVPPSGSYFTFNSQAQAYYAWFTVDSVGTDPAPGGIGYKVNLLSTYSSTEKISCIKESVSGYQISSVICVPAGSIIPGSFFTFGANSLTYNVYYVINNTGTAPLSGFNVKVSLNGSETAIQVASLTQIAINNVYFGVVDASSMVLVGPPSGHFPPSSPLNTYSLITGDVGTHPGGLKQFSYGTGTQQVGQLIVNWAIKY